MANAAAAKAPAKPQGYDDDQIRKLVGGNASRLLGLNEPRKGA